MAKVHSKDDLLIVLTTEADLNKAKFLANSLLDLKLVACVSLSKVHSFYMWEGNKEENKEVQLLMKTSINKKYKLQKAINELHSYETPELIGWNAEASDAYSQWLLKSLY